MTVQDYEGPIHSDQGSPPEGRKRLYPTVEEQKRIKEFERQQRQQGNPAPPEEWRDTDRDIVRDEMYRGKKISVRANAAYLNDLEARLREITANKAND